MNVGELFINLSVKGTEKTIGALTDTKKGLSNIGDASLEAKAGILAVAYTMERLFALSGQMGTGLTNFTAYTGQSAKALQQWQFAARQAGESSEELTGNLKSVQSAITKTLMGQGAPSGMAMVAKLTGGISKEQMRDMANNPFLMMQRLQEYALKEKNVGLRNETLKSFGLSEGTISAMARNAFRPDVLARAPTYGDKEIGALDRANIAWSNLGNKIQMAFGHFNSKHGVQLVQDISKVTDQVIKLVEALTNLAEKIKVFSIIGKAFSGWTSLLDVGTKTVDNVQSEKGRKEIGNFLKDIPKVLGLMGEDAIGALGNIGYTPSTQSSIAPTMPAQVGSGSTQNIKVNQNLNFQHDGKDVHRTSDSVKKAIQDSYRQMSAQTQGS